MIYLHSDMLSIQQQLVDAVDAPTACDQGQVSTCVRSTAFIIGFPVREIIVLTETCTV
jgi:hypothetical protein